MLGLKTQSPHLKKLRLTIITAMLIGKRNGSYGLGDANIQVKGVKSIEVKVVAGNDAIRLYEKYGFQINAHILKHNSYPKMRTASP